ncbi:MAG: PD40 domain-containing protein [Burkholderiales bacterium]|nr:PD40 domain-containing protein [Anaerolineae bacterium]
MVATVTGVVMRLGAGVGAAVALLVGGAGALGRALPSSGQLAYTTQEFAADARQLHLIDVGHNLRRDLALYYAIDDLVWSPDGESLAFAADEPAQIFVYQPFGEAAPRSLQSSDEFAIDTQPAWIGTGGQRVAFLSLQYNQWSIKVADVSSGQIDTVNVLSDRVDTPSWSPDGQQLAFSSLYGLHQAIYVADLSGNVRQLTRSIGTDLLPEWSPDGAPSAGRIAFFSDRDGGWNIYVIDAAQPLDMNSSENDSAQRVTTTPIGLLNFGWSADGQQIVFTGVNNFQHELYTQPIAAGSAARQLTQGMEADEDAVWSPDNALIAYIFWGDFPEIRIIAANGSHSRRFVDDDIVTSSLAWRP